MDWYIPITIIPGIGLLVLSTSNMILALNVEISNLESSTKECNWIIKDKLSQLKILSISIIFQYLSIFLFLLSGIASFFSKENIFPKIVMIMGVFLISISIIMQLFYAIKAVKIRQNHLKISN